MCIKGWLHHVDVPWTVLSCNYSTNACNLKTYTPLELFNTTLKTLGTFLHWLYLPNVGCEGVDDEEPATHGTAAVKMEREDRIHRLCEVRVHMYTLSFVRLTGQS